MGWMQGSATGRVFTGLRAVFYQGLSCICPAVQRLKSVLIEVGVPCFQGLAFHALGSGVDVGGIEVFHGVIEQHLAHQVIDTQIHPLGTRHLAQVMARPFALGHSLEQGAGQRRANSPASAARE